VAGVELLRRAGGTPGPEELARRVLGALLGRAFEEPLRPGEERSSFATAAEWALVQPPRVEGGRLSFFAMEGDMAPTLVEQSVELETFGVTRRTAREILLARGETVVISEPLCVPFASCGCWSGCMRVERVAAPAKSVATVRVVEGPYAGKILEQRHECSGERCFAVCTFDAPDSFCGDPYLMVDEACTGACPPSEAPFHCDTHEDRCERVEHPGRVAAVAG